MQLKLGLQTQQQETERHGEAEFDSLRTRCETAETQLEDYKSQLMQCLGEHHQQLELLRGNLLEKESIEDEKNSLLA